MSVQENERHPVDRLAEEFVDRYRRGERPSISEYTQKYPELAADLQELLAALALMEEHARIHVQPDAAARAEPLAGFAPPAQLGDYRVLREIGRGGMGVVYEAVQESLGRHVALKVLPSHALLDSVRLKRFQHEAQAAARLHHTNIVPIFGVGEADGVSFYAMQFIQGRGLDEVIAELRHLKRASNQAAKELPEAVAEVKAANEQAARRTPAARTNLSTITDTPRFYRSVAALGAQIADALDHAHRQGVLHRDIKPSNLLLDTAGTIWITDFGLAKADGMEELTHSGDLVGTLRYMAPEHLQGKADARADIYSLASSLYELLALRPAFDAAERAALIRQIAHEEPLRLRRLDSRIPRDLETIVQKAMAHDPALRYATAGAMAADLRRFVDDKPIAARPVSGPERLWRWCLRRPALAGLCAALALSVVVGVVGVLWQWGRAERNLREAVHQKGIAVELLQVAQQSQRRAEQNSVEAARQQSIAERRASEADENYQTARQAVHELLTMASEDDLLTQPGLQPLRVQLLSRALQFYEERLADRDSDPTARRDLALAYLRLGIIKQQIGPTGNAAEDAYRRAIALLSPDEQRSGPGGRSTRILLSKIENNLALELLRQNKLEAAHEVLEGAQQRLTAQLEANHDDFEAQAVQAMTLNNIGYHLSLLGTMTPAERNERAVRLHEEALALYREVAEHQPDELRARHSVANTLSNLGRRHQALHHFPQARQFMEECLAIREELVRAQPSSLEFQADTAAASNALGDVIMASDLTPQQRLQQALPHYLQALKLQERLVQENPPVLRFLQDLGNLPLNIADACMQAGENEQAQQWRQREIAIWDRCLALDNENADVQRLRAWALDKQGEVEQRLGNYAAALESWFSARQAWVALEKSPTTFAAQRGKVIVNFKQLMVELGQQGRAAELVSVAAERQKLAGDSPDERLSLCYDLERACRAARRGSQMPAAHAGALAEHLRLAVQTFRDVAAAEPVKSDQYARARKSMTPYIPLIELDAELKRGPESVKRLIERSQVLRQLGDEPAAQRDEARAFELLAAMPNSAVVHRQRAQLHFAAGRFEEAIEESSCGLRFKPKEYLLLRLRALAAMHAGRWQEAADDFASVLEDRPKLVFYWPRRLHCLMLAGRESEAHADAERLPALAKASGQNADYVTWHLLELGEAGRFGDAALQIARAAAQRHATNEYRCELGGVQYYRGEYRDALGNLQPAASQVRTSPSVLAGFWLALCQQELGSSEEAQQAYRQALRNWKGLPALPADEEALLHSLWQSARSALGESASLAHR